MKSESFGWSDLRVFLAVAEAGSTLAAARGLSLSQPTVARRIDALEHATGLQLFTRDTRGFHLTEAGRALLAPARAMAGAARAVESAMQEMRELRPIRVTAFAANLSPRIAAIFSAFAERRPDIAFEFLPGSRVLDLMAGEADVAIRVTRAPPDERLIQRKVSVARYALYGSVGYLEAHGPLKSLDDLAGHRFVSYRNDDTRPYFDDWFRARLAPGQLVHTFKEIDLMLAAMRSGTGLGLGNVRFLDADPGLVRASPPVPELDAEHLILVSPEAHRRPEVRAFLKFFAPRYRAIFRD